MSNNSPNKGSKIFIIAFIVFLSVIILLVWDMASRTTAPWNRTKPQPDSIESLLPDSLFQTDSL